MRPERLLTAISQSAAALFREKEFGKAVARTLRKLGEATGVSRVYLFEIHYGPRGGILASQRYEWCAPGITPQIDNPDLQNIPGSAFRSVMKHLRKKPFFGVVEEIRPPALRRLLESQQVQSLLLVPVYVHREWYGFIGFDECVSLRRWTRAEISTLSIAAKILGGAIERRRGEERLRSILEDAIDTLGTGLFILDRNFRVVWVNRTMENFFGISRRSLAGRDMRGFIRERLGKILTNAPAFEADVLASYRKGGHLKRLRCEVRPRRGRRRRILRYWSTPVTHGELSGGRIEHFIDVTEVERANVALRLSEKKYRDLVEKLPEGVSYADEQEVIRYANESFCRMLGYGREEVTGFPIAHFLDEEGGRELARQARLRRSGVHSRYRLSVRSSSGEMVPLEISASPVFDEQGNYRGSYGVVSDVREMRKLDQLKDDLLRDMSHELKAPTANIVMGLNLIEKNRGTPGSDEFSLGCRMIRSEIARIQGNIESLIDLSALETGVARLVPGRFDLAALTREVVAEMGESARAKGITLSFAGGKRNKILMRGDRDKIHVLLRHLIENSIKFSDSGSVVVDLARRGGRIEASVADEGRGIHRSYLNKIFERHFQRFPSVPGIGIGLTLCRRIVELHGGKIWAESGGLGAGMTMHVELPASPKKGAR